MATVLAQTGANVLIIDADMRQPTLHEIFDLDNKRGLSTLLASNFTEAETLSLIQKDLDTGLGVLTAGPVPPQPAELLSSDRMRRLLAIVSDSFTHVVIDSTPMVSFTDSVLIASLVDGVILVVQGGKSPYEIVQHSRKELHDVGANIYGVVLNNADVSAQDSYYYYQQPA
jgi:capsular exopolysaccharide synthesis family protein